MAIPENYSQVSIEDSDFSYSQQDFSTHNNYYPTDKRTLQEDNDDEEDLDLGAQSGW